MILCSQLPMWSSSQNSGHIESAKRVILTHVNKRTNPHKQEFITHSGLRSSRIWSSCEILIISINGFTTEVKYFLVQSYTNSLHRIPPLTCLHMNDLDQIICNDYKVGRINSVTRIRHPTLSIYYRLFRLLLHHDPLVCQPHTIQDYINNLRFSYDG